MDRAKIANRLAKSVEGRWRRAAYDVKHEALAALTERFPSDVHVVEDSANPLFVLVTVDHTRFGLHVPEEVFVDKGLM